MTFTCTANCANLKDMFDAARISVTVSASSDTTAPVITPNVAGAQTNGWYTSDVTVSWTVADSEPPVTSTDGCDTTTITSDTAGTTLIYTATSAGGTASQSVTIKRDTGNPTISGSATPGANANGWRNTDVAVSFSCSDPMSGIASCVGATTLAADGANQSVSGTATDNAGHTATATVSGINIDKTAPSVGTLGNLTATATSTSGAVVSYTFAPTDSLSGIDATNSTCDKASGTVFPLGTNTVTCSATDLAGNLATGTFTVAVTYAWSGVLQPIKVDGSSVFKLGSTVPVKFQLTGASAGISNLQARIFYALVTNGAPEPDAQAVSTSAADTGNLFRYDATNDQYIFNLGTKSLSQGTYQLRIDLGDGTTNTVLIALK